MNLEKILSDYDAMFVNYELEKTETFELLETSTQQVYQFDDVDLVAMEIFELLQD